MGQVYRATDTQLGRDVALKILPDAFAADPDRLARFQREAQVLASLNHPNIAQIHGIEKSDDTQALVLELVEGPTLADRIAKGPIPLDEALPIAKQIAEALEAAHEAGVIHRDLKPANIKVREDGTVKVLDFGLAKALDPTPTGDPSQSPTLTAAATQMGVIMGTAAYMSPEHARGKPVDKRADIWVFGVVLYEMLSGSRPFEGEDVSLTLASVMKSDVNAAMLPADVPETLRTVIRQCLQKDPKRRIRDVADAQLAMEGAFDTSVGAPAVQVVVPTLRAWQRPIPAALGAFAVAVVAGYAGWGIIPAEAPGALPTRLTTVPPLGVEAGGRVVLSPDGRTLAFSGVSEEGRHVHIRRLDELAAVPLRGGEGTGPIAFSPDGQALLVHDVDPDGNARYDALVKRIPLRGGAPTTVGQGQGGAPARQNRRAYPGGGTCGTVVSPRDSWTVI